MRCNLCVRGYLDNTKIYIEVFISLSLSPSSAFTSARLNWIKLQSILVAIGYWKRVSPFTLPLTSLQELCYISRCTHTFYALADIRHLSQSPLSSSLCLSVNHASSRLKAASFLSCYCSPCAAPPLLLSDPLLSSPTMLPSQALHPPPPLFSTFVLFSSLSPSFFRAFSTSSERHIS